MEDEKLYYVYGHFNKINNKCYIGITRINPNNRWRKDGKGYKRQKLFYRAIQKYGWDNFKHEILFEGLTEQEAKNKEIELIAFYKSNNKDFGYNITSGGDTGSGKHTEETCKKMSEIAKKRFRNNPEANTNASRIECENIIFGSIVQCAEYYGYTPSQIRNYLNGKSVCPKFFVENNLKYKEKETKLKLYKNYAHGKFDKKKVYCKELGIIYDSILEAENKTGVQSGNIIKVCQNFSKTAGGYTWAYL